MPRLNKTAFTDFASTGCEKQLRLSLHPDSGSYLAERKALNLPHQQVRPALQIIAEAGNEWGRAKVLDLQLAFGADRLLGKDPKPSGPPSLPGVAFATGELSLYLARAAAGDFLIENEFDADNSTFIRLHGLDEVESDGAQISLDLSRVRPDIIEVQSPQSCISVVTPEGDVRRLEAADDRLILRVIDVKLTTEPGPRYFAELAYYCLALAAWLRHTGLEDTYAVSASAAVWPGSEGASPLSLAVAEGNPNTYDAFHESLEEAPLRIFVATVRRVIRVIIPRVLATPFDALPWNVGPRCQGCENLGQKFYDEPGTNASDWDPRHCIPLAKQTQNLSRLPFLSRGSMTVLRSNGHEDLPAIAGLEPSNTAFDSHHRLRGQRTMVSKRARALTGLDTNPLDSATASTAAMPRFAKLRIYLTADFDPGSALTLAFGMTWSWVDATTKLTSVQRMRMHYTEEKTVEAEWTALLSLLSDISTVLHEAEKLDDDPTFQVYVWDDLSLKHLTRVVGRHLGHILTNGELARLAWLFPPEEILPSGRLAGMPAISVTKNAVRSLLTLDIAHTYTLLGTARAFHRPDHPNPKFYVPMFWEDPFSDQVPPERAHQVWGGQRSSHSPTKAQLASDLLTTVRSKLAALSNVTDFLSRELTGRLPREAPKISHLGPTKELPASSHLGALLYAHARLNAALSQLEKNQLRTLPLAEREAKFESAILEERLNAKDAAEVLQLLAIEPSKNALVYKVAQSSKDAKIKQGSFNWSLLPKELTQSGGLTVKRFLNSHQEQADGFSQFRDELFRRTLNQVFAATILGIDRSRGFVVLELSSYSTDPDIRKQLEACGLVNLALDVVLDPTDSDFFTKALGEVIRAVGNPPSSPRSLPIQQALGSGRNPRNTKAHPAETFIWAPQEVSESRNNVDLSESLERLESAGVSLNDSQKSAWGKALTSHLTLIWGPPGTGKTATLRALLFSLVHLPKSTRPLRIGVVAGTYTAVDTLLESFVQRFFDDLPTNIRRLRSGGPAVTWLTEEENVLTKDSGALASVKSLLNGEHAVIVAGTPQQLRKLGTDKGGLFDVLLIDEAGQLDVAHALMAIAGLTKKGALVVAGDPKQLPPIHQADPPIGLESFVGSIYDYYRTGHDVPEKSLLVNYRSNDTIVQLGKRAGYPDELTSANPKRKLVYSDAASEWAIQGLRPSRWPAGLAFSDIVPAIASPSREVVCVVYPEGVSGQWNDFEAALVAQVVAWYRLALEDGDLTSLRNDEIFWTQKLGIVTPHRAQRTRVIDVLLEHLDDGSHSKELRHWIESAVDTVERFQGQERDIIVATYAVGDPDTIAEESEFLLSLNRFNVLATRPRDKLVVIASRELAEHIDSDLDVIRNSVMIKDFVDLYCNQSRAWDVSLDPSEPVVHAELRWHDSAWPMES